MKRSTPYVARDVHQKTNVAWVGEESGGLVARSVRPDGGGITTGVLRRDARSVHLACEEGTGAQWLHDCSLRASTTCSCAIGASRKTAQRRRAGSMPVLIIHRLAADRPGLRSISGRYTVPAFAGSGLMGFVLPSKVATFAQRTHQHVLQHGRHPGQAVLPRNLVQDVRDLQQRGILPASPGTDRRPRPLGREPLQVQRGFRRAAKRPATRSCSRSRSCVPVQPG